MRIKELRPGDILLFSGESGSPISDLITYLTKSSVSHAAMVYTDTSEIIEETPPAVHVNSVKERINGGKVVVMRHNPLKKTYAPVLNVARKHLNYNQPYAHERLYILGLLLLYKRFVPGVRAQKVMVKIFKKITSELLGYIDRYIYPGKSPMCCSQFIYRCYEEAGDEYHLNMAQAGSCYDDHESAKGKTLIRQVIQRVKNDISEEFRNYIQDYSNQDLGAEISQNDIELAKELLRSIQAKNDHATGVLDKELVVAIYEFGQAVYQAMTGISMDYNELEYSNKTGIATSGLSLLCLEEADFVSPGDLLNNCANLTQVGEIHAR